MSPTPDIGEKVGSWLLLERLGVGGAGIVFRAEHSTSRQIAAVKILTGAADPNAAARMRNEARILKRIRHPQIAEYIEYVDHHGLPCLVMRYVPGPTLAEYLQRSGPVREQAALTIIQQIATAVGYLHAQGIVHRDLKPENVKIGQSSEAVLLDFGIARDDRSATMTRVHRVIGTLGYLAPERLRGEPATTRTDVWALGVMLVEILSGRSPFDADAIEEVGYRQKKGWRAALPAATVSPRVAELLDRCLAVRPERRPPDAGAMATSVHDAVGVATGGDDRINGSSRPWATASAARRMLIGVAAAAVLAAAVSWMLGGPTVPVGPKSVDNGPAHPPASTLAEVLVETSDGPAEIYSRGQPIGTTPYRAQLPVGDKVELELRRLGYEPYPVQFEVRPVENRYALVLQRTP